MQTTLQPLIIPGTPASKVIDTILTQGKIFVWVQNKQTARHSKVLLFFKRFFDIAFSLIFSVLVLSWLIPVIAILIKLDSPGPFFFMQIRTGYLNRPFYCIKFRTMYVNDIADTLQASDSDKRITRFGSFLRNTHLDELPQFINVLLGSMSLIGPRPHMLFHTARFKKDIGNYYVRHLVKPGITGLAQVKGWRGPTPAFRNIYKRIQWDIYYVKHPSLKTELYIFASTIKIVLNGIFRRVFKLRGNTRA
jgi:putative colanic acid biosynthesis UDP-glucose lipid carrier transferase